MKEAAADVGDTELTKDAVDVVFSDEIGSCSI